MPRWPRPPNLLRLFVGQHIINGASVGLGVVAVALVASAIFGFAAGQPATLGAISASISDLPAPWREKAKTLGFGFALALLSTVAIQLALPWPVAALVMIGAHQLCRRSRHRARPMGGGGRHAGGHPDGLHSRIPARDFPGRGSNRAAARGRGRRLYRVCASGDGLYRRQRPPAGHERIDPRILDLHARGRRRFRSRPGTGCGLWRNDPPTVDAFGAIAVGALALARSAGRKGRADAARGVYRHPARRARCAGRRPMRRRSHPADTGGRDSAGANRRRPAGRLARSRALEPGAPDHRPPHSAARPSARDRRAQARGGAGGSRSDGPESACGARRHDLATRPLAQPRPAPGARLVGRRDGARLDRRRQSRRLHPETPLRAERARAPFEPRIRRCSGSPCAWRWR